jgi:hypothetical protein
LARYVVLNPVRAGVGQPSLWEQLQGQLFLGGEAFIAKMQGAMSARTSIAEIPRIQRRPVAKPLAHYRASAEEIKAGMVAAYATGDYTMQQIAECFGVHYGTVSRAVAQAVKGDAFAV